MMSRRRCFETHLLAVLGSLALLVQAPRARAEATSNQAAVEAQRSEAKLRFERGVEHYRAGRYAEAVSSFLEADRLVPSPALSFNIARAYEELDDTANALRWYRDYLRRKPDAPNAADVKGRVEKLALKLSERGLQQLTVLSAPSGATVSIDGFPVGVTPFTAELAPGKHHVLLALPGYREASSEVLLAKQFPGELRLALQAQLEAGARPEAPHTGGGARDQDRPESARRFGVLPWVVASTGALSLGGALGFELARRADERDAGRAPTQLAFQKQVEDAENHQTAARVLLGVGGGLLVTGGVMLIFNERSKVETRMGLGCTPQGCTAVAKGSF